MSKYPDAPRYPDARASLETAVERPDRRSESSTPTESERPSSEDAPEAAASFIVEARGVGRRRSGSDAWLFRDVSVDLAPGERVAVVGPTGSGKTVLLRALALLDPLDEGTILWRGRPVRDHDVPRYRAGVAYVHQKPVLFRGTVEDNLRQPFHLHVHRGRSYDADRTLRLLSEVGRDGDFLSRSERNLSGGERQLVQLVRVLQLAPDVLLLDEPTAALDAGSAASIEKLVLSWQEKKPDRRALVWVSHDPRQVSRVAGREIRVG